ncbi:putative leucine-rich repeat-containing protein DDB_G0290503 [Cylas formicarius]|uniref:putative leucine-rich repeat-containing protein DDB_G0290503 n=1 Tax=Cylas formicarius TaxID=197179 RepID=UPI0029583495|nr:putative leucine-rich repeat-containing protein DDB_G0290503 [Cylas formicarius]
MTRFARSKGSKASNERIPEAATSWSELKQQLLSSNKDILEKNIREEALQRREANYQAFLREREEEQLRNVTWADFDSKEMRIDGKTADNLKKSSHNTNGPHLMLNARKSIGEFLEENDSDEPPEECGVKDRPKEVIVEKKIKKRKLKIVSVREEQFHDFEENKSELTKAKPQSPRSLRKIEKKDRSQKQLKKKLKQKKEKMNEVEKNVNENVIESSNSLFKNAAEDLSKIEKKKQRRMRQAEKRKKFKELKLSQLNSEASKDNVSKNNDYSDPNSNLSEDVLAKIEKRKQKKIRQAEKRKKFKELKKLEEGSKNSVGNSIDDKSTIPHVLAKKHKKDVPKMINKRNKIGDNAQPSRKKSLPERMIINGKSVDIDYIEGFPVKKEDADRLRKLKKEMINKGVPRSEIEVALKLERRKAEKALAREKKKVCFNCRLSGHNLSECPALGKGEIVESAGTGICFKCGSTEHTHFECKVVRADAYKFAKCFICNEQGHISRQCPDNQRGLYPKGGSCKVCGDVTHLKKDCPNYQVQQQQLQQGINVGTLGDSNPDDFDTHRATVGNRIAKPSKIVKF